MDKSQVIILGAGKPFSGEKPSALVETPKKNRRVLDWLLDAFRQLGDVEFHFVGGYRLEEVVARYPSIYFSVNSDWRDNGATGSLLAAPLDGERTTYVCYADTVFSPEIVEALSKSRADVTLCMDRQWRERYAGRSNEDLGKAEKIVWKPDQPLRLGRSISSADADGELVGVIRFSPRAITAIQELGRSDVALGLASWDLPSLIGRLIELELDVEVLENPGRWAELNAPQDLARFILGTKAETLERLRPLVRTCSIGAQVCFTVAEWRENQISTVARIQDQFGAVAIVVRSSAKSEDGWLASNAGGHESVLNVLATRSEEIVAAVERVIDSYGRVDNNDQVLIQAMLKDVAISGVVFTRTLTYGAPYYVINYDDRSGRTDSVTSGTEGELRTLFVRRSRRRQAVSLDPQVGSVLASVAELEGLVGHTSLDIEFAVQRNGQVQILQLRPIVVRHMQVNASDERIDAALDLAVNWYAGSVRRGSNLLGTRSLFGVMPDWNPAEIVGTKPRRLALSLYRHLVTDDVWALQRAEYGYRDVRPCPLIVNFVGHPYVDIRASFNSFIPAALDNEVAERLIDHYLERLVQRPELHDKVEFDVVFTCSTFDFHERADERLKTAGFSNDEIKQIERALLEITRKGIARLDTDFAVIDQLESRYQLLTASNSAPFDCVFELLEDCRRFGTLPFAHLARNAFVAVNLLRSLERLGVTTRAETSAFLASLDSVTRAFERDGAQVHGGELPWEEFLNRYGHLRPGTYEITSEAYADDPQRYLAPMVKPNASSSQPFSWSESARTDIQRLLHEQGFGISLEEFERFMRRAIQGREFAKFIFSRNLSAALTGLAEFGKMHGLDREAMSHLDIADIYKLRVGAHPPDVGVWLSARADEGLADHQFTRAIELPPLIVGERDFTCFERPSSEPNFVSQGRVAGEIVVLAEGDAVTTADLAGKVVAIPRADPGYDWIFAHGICGLVTQYGGANSHMAIRAAELALPAAIGVGEALFERLSAAQNVLLDCDVRKIEIQGWRV